MVSSRDPKQWNCHSTTLQLSPKHPAPRPSLDLTLSSTKRLMVAKSSVKIERGQLKIDLEGKNKNLGFQRWVFNWQSGPDYLVGIF